MLRQVYHTTVPCSRSKGSRGGSSHPREHIAKARKEHARHGRKEDCRAAAKGGKTSARVPTSYSDRTFSQVVVENLEFSPLERKIYDSLYTDAKKNFDKLNEKGLVSRNYTHILAMLMR